MGNPNGDADPRSRGTAGTPGPWGNWPGHHLSPAAGSDGPTGPGAVRLEAQVAATADDLLLAARLREGDRAAFTALYDRHAPAVHGLTRAILRDDALAEEATHDVFLGLWLRPAAFEPGRGTFAGWLLRVARIRAIDLLRRRRDHPFVDADAASGDSALGRLVDPAADPADEAIQRVVGGDVRAALADLPPDQRRLLELAYFDGLTQREIAAHLDRPLGTVKSQVRAAMRHLADRLVGFGPAAAAAAAASSSHGGTVPGTVEPTRGIWSGGRGGDGHDG